MATRVDRMQRAVDSATDQQLARLAGRDGGRLGFGIEIRLVPVYCHGCRTCSRPTYQGRHTALEYAACRSDQAVNEVVVLLGRTADEAARRLKAALAA